MLDNWCLDTMEVCYVYFMDTGLIVYYTQVPSIFKYSGFLANVESILSCWTNI